MDGGEKGWWKYQIAFQNVVTQQQFLLLSSCAKLWPIKMAIIPSPSDKHSCEFLN